MSCMNMKQPRVHAGGAAEMAGNAMDCHRGRKLALALTLLRAKEQLMKDDIRTQLWTALDDSPFLMVGLTGEPMHSLPMTAILDKDAHGAFWFYTTRHSRIARGGPAMAQFAARKHELFACISGTLHEEQDPAVIDRHWSNDVAAWFEGGRTDPDLLMLRFDLDDAEIWTADLGVKGLFKLMTGQTIRPEEAGTHAEVKL
jgi:general stress protein 26